MIKIPMAYYYKGSSNCEVILKNDHSIIEVRTQYEELVTKCYNVNELIQALSDLNNNKFA